MHIRFWGVRGSFPVPGPSTNIYGGNTACVEVCPDKDTIIILDAGTGIRKLGQKLMTGPCGQGSGIVHLLISHTHWDHIQGIPFFAPLYQKGNQINIYARQRDVHLRTIFASQAEDPYFSVNLDEVAAEVTYTELVEGACFKINAVDVRCARLNHPYIAIGYRLQIDSTSIAYVSDTAPFDRIVFEHQFIPQCPDPQSAPAEVDAIKLQHMHQGVIELCQGCDLVIYDTMFRMDEYLARPHWGHSTLEHAIEIVEKAAAKSLVLFHHAPNRSDEEVLNDLNAAQEKTAIHVLAAQEGMILAVADGVRRVS